MKTVIHESLHKWLITALVSVFALFMLQFATNAPFHMGPVLAVLLLWTLLMAVVDRLLRPLAVVILLFFVTTATFAAFEGAPLIEYTAALYGGGALEASLLGDTVILLEMAILSCVAMYAFAEFWPRVVLSVCWIPCWVWAALQELELPKISLAAIIPVALFTLVEGILRFRSGKDEKRFAELAPVLMVFFTTVGAFLMLLPTSPEPYGYPVLNAILDKVEEFYEDTVTRIFYREDGDEEFSLDFAGYSDEAETGDGGKTSHEITGELLAKARHNLDDNLYLIGNSWDTFNGRAWTSSIAGDADGLLDWNVDAAERIYALWRYQNQQERPIGVTNYFKNTSVYLLYQDMRTRTLFTVPNTIHITTDTQRFPWGSEPGRVLFDYLQTKDTYYRIHYLAQNQRYLPDLIGAVEGYAYDGEDDLIWRAVFGSYRSEFGLTLDTFDTDSRIEPVLAQRQELIYENYLALSADISQEARALAEEITRNCATDYEKLEAIADYLQSNYTYTMEPAPVPEDKVFLDYVLFEAKEGYCTWYATAATLLARCVGVPARYVQGYCLPLEAGVLTAVEGSSSHAWCEGYVPGFGWVTVEATPGFTGAGAFWGDATSNSEEPQKDEEELPPEETETPAEEDAAKKTDLAVMKYFGVGLFLAAFAALSMVVWRQERVRRRYQSASYAGKAVLDLEAFLKAPVRREYRRQSSESLRQYFARLRWSLHLDPKLMDDMTALYEEILFAERELAEEEWRACREFLAMLKKVRRKQIWTN